MTKRREPQQTVAAAEDCCHRLHLYLQLNCPSWGLTGFSRKNHRPAFRDYDQI
jgi:hypothetical protein